MADADGSLGSNHPTVRSRVEMLTDDTPAPSQRRAPVARSPIRISGAPARMTADGTNVAKPEIVMRSRTSKPAVGPGDHNYMDPDEAELFFLPESKAYPTEMPPGELRNLICSILPAEALGDCTINSDIRAKIDCVVQTNPDFMNSTQSAVNRVLQTLTRKADQREEGMALILAAVAEDVNRMFSHESPLLLTFGMIAQAHLHQNFIAFHTEIGDWAGKKPAVLSELDESMMALLEILENGCANVKEMTAMLLAVREEETEMLRKRSRIGNEAFYSEEHKAEREDFMKISSDMSSRRNQFTSARDMFTKDMVNAVCLFIGRSPPATATRVIKPLSVPAKVSDEPNARMAKQFCNNVIDYMVQEPENAYISMAVIHYLFEKIHTYDQPIAPYMDNGSVKGPMIELPEVCIEQYEIESTLMAKYMRRHHPDLMRKFGRGASLSSAENSDPVSFETEREDGIGGLMSVIFTHAERKTSHKLELRDDIERFAGKFVDEFNKHPFKCVQLKLEPCMFIITNTDTDAVTHLLIHVDDIDAICDDSDDVIYIFGQLASKFGIKECDPDIMLGIQRKMSLADGIRFLDITMERFVTDMYNKWKAKRNFKLSTPDIPFPSGKQLSVVGTEFCPRPDDDEIEATRQDFQNSRVKFYGKHAWQHLICFLLQACSHASHLLAVIRH
jgi:hypothetical protein